MLKNAQECRRESYERVLNETTTQRMRSNLAGVSVVKVKRMRHLFLTFCPHADGILRNSQYEC